MLTERSLTPHLHPSIFRAYDIRGIVNETLTVRDVHLIGCALGTMALDIGEKSIVVGRDGRLSGAVLSEALFSGILSTGCDVIDIGMVPTPLLYYATHRLETGSGVMLTGSHNPAEYNGLKMILGGESLTEGQIKALYHSVMAGHFRQGTGQLSTVDIVTCYVKHVADQVKVKRRIKVVIDAGNGVAGKVVPALYRELGCDVVELFCEIDGSFPHHHPDPSQAENMQDLIKAVQKHDADIGLAFDGDADRLGVVTNRGEIIWPDRQLMLFAKAVLLKHPGAKIIYDVKCSHHLAKVIKALGGEPIMWKTGHSLIKSKLKETQALLAGEMSGHIFFQEGWYGFDDAIYAGARLLQLIADEQDDVSTLFSRIPDSINTPELKIVVGDEEKFLLMQKIIHEASFENAEKITIDGLRVNFPDGWGLVRPSNTTPCLVLRFEANTASALARIQQLFREMLLGVNADLVLPF